MKLPIINILIIIMFTVYTISILPFNIIVTIILLLYKWNKWSIEEMRKLLNILL